MSFDMAQLVASSSRRAHTLLMRFNMRMVAQRARMCAGRGVDFEDLMVEGALSLRDGIAAFDPSRGTKLSSIVFIRLKRDMDREIARCGRVIRLPDHANRQLGALLRARRELLEAGDEDYKIEMARNKPLLHQLLAQATGISERQVARLLWWGLPVASADSKLYEGNNEDSTLVRGEDIANLAPAASSGTEDAELAGDAGLEEEGTQEAAQKSLAVVLETLDARERNIVRLRYGLNAERRVVPRSEIAAAYGLGAERVRQIEDIAVKKLSKPWRREFLDELFQR